MRTKTAKFESNPPPEHQPQVPEKSDHGRSALLASLLAGKLPRSCRFSDVIELVSKIGEVQAHGADKFAFVIGTQRAFFARPDHGELGTEEISRLRTLLHEAGLHPEASEPRHPGRMIVVIDHHIARLYQDLGESVPEEEAAVRPYDPYGFHRHLIHRKEAHYRGDRVPEEASYYEQIAGDLVHATEIVLIGHGTGKSSAVDFLADYLKKHHPTLSQRMIATETADLSALTEPEIEEIAQAHL